MIQVLQTASPAYRAPVWNALDILSEGRSNVLAGSRYFDPTIVTSADGISGFRLVRNIFFARRRLVVQLWPLGLLNSRALVVIELNPRIVSNWVLIIARRALRRRTFVWGHLDSKTTARTQRLARFLMRALASGTVCYTHAEAKRADASNWLVRRRPLIVAPNALSRKSEMQARISDDATDFVYVGRMVTAKRPDLLLKAFLRAADKLPVSSRLVMVGDGPLLPELRAEASRNHYGDRVAFHGYISDQSDLRQIYSRALASVSPGYVGLSVIQSHGFGVPMIVADDEPHSPEIEAVRPGENAVMFTARSEHDLAAKMLLLSADRETWLARGPAIATSAAAQYSVETLAKTLLDEAKRPARSGKTRA